MKIAESKGQEIPKEKRFDPNCITPGIAVLPALLFVVLKIMYFAKESFKDYPLVDFLFFKPCNNFWLKRKRRRGGKGREKC